MNRRSVLHWVALTAIFTAVVSVFSTFKHSEAATKAPSQTAGTLRVVDETGKPVAECPLKRTAVRAEVSGFMSRVTVTQNFENPFPDKIEAVYTFPLPEMAAVDDLTMQIGDRTIKGKIMRRADASAAYAAAKQMGKVASLLDQERANVFTQQVANILPGHQIQVTISYVETLKYEDGSYQWSFPMVVAPRYQSASSDQDDSSRLNPPRVPSGMRAGHDVSLEINLDAGIPLAGVKSATHEIDIQQVDEKRAVVRLKDQATIPNKDFLLTYGVASDTIKDAVLAHNSDRGGFFTLILQPPQRVQAEDVMPKEMVFVLDTSGSMSGDPIETAKKTMRLALNTLYPHDTFNLITFSGDTDILFPHPMPATPENLRKARQFFSNREGDGGTEMMKAIKAALDPSDSQFHVRIATFMTDGQVGNDNEILAEVQKHKNARVFAMGFGSSPNRALLDKMTQYGRGEVDYVAYTSNPSSVASRFNNRIRNPLLTDLSIEWSDLSITEVYPKRIPDLFSAKPVILSGRYTKGGKGTIRLKGKMAGQDFVREIPVELPDVEASHDALATLWARNKIDDLTAEEVAYTGDATALEQKREEIAQLGLTFKLMTQYTSFIAVDEGVYTGGDDPRRVDVPIEAATNVTVTASGAPLQYGAFTVQSLTQHSIQDLPIQGRSFLGLLTLTGPAQSSQSGISMRGQSTNFMIDGVSANFGITPGGESPGASAAGQTPALTASGGANGTVIVDAAQEILINSVWSQTESNVPQLSVTTRTGSNRFHGSAFHFFGNDKFDANDPFANARGFDKPAKRLNIFGGMFGGPINRDKTFFFASYEGLRLRQPMTGITDVPSVSARQAAPDSIRTFLNAFPLPTGASRPDGFAEFAASFANPARHETGSIRIDHMLSPNINLRGRYNFADSEAMLRGANGFSLNTTNRVRTRAQSITGAWQQTLSPTVVFELDANYSTARANGSYVLDQFGGATIPVLNIPPAESTAFDLNSRNAGFLVGDDASNIQRQINLTGTTTVVSRNHTWQFGADFRRLSPIINPRGSEQNAFFDGVGRAITGTADRITNLVHSGPKTPIYKSLSLFAQNDWRKSFRFNLILALRWELEPAPSSDQAFAVDQVNDPVTLTLAAPRTPLWATTFGNFAPRAGFAYELSNDSDFVLRGGVNILYDRGQDRSGDIFTSAIPFISGSSVFNSPFQSIDSLPLVAFDPHLKLPYTINWNVTVQKAVGDLQTFSVAYVGSSGHRLLRTDTLFNQNPDFPFLRLTTNRSNSDHHALNFKFERNLRNGLATLVSYVWSHSTDNVIHDSERRIILTSVDPELDRGPSDFDVRHHLNGFISYELPAPFSQGLGNTVLRNWAVDSIFNARSAKPFNGFFLVPTSTGFALFRPDDVSRNSSRGFPFYQVDLALRRKFHFTDSFILQAQADAYNLFNHPNLEDPHGHDLILGTPFRSNFVFGQSTSLSGRSLSSGGFPSFYGVGGARTLRFSLKLVF